MPKQVSGSVSRSVHHGNTVNRRGKVEKAPKSAQRTQVKKVQAPRKAKKVVKTVNPDDRIWVGPTPQEEIVMPAVEELRFTIPNVGKKYF